MIPGSTPTHVFKIPLTKEKISVVWIVYVQNGNVVLKKTTKDCKIEDNKITTKLTQKESLMFRNNQQVQIQIRVLTPNGDSLVSKVIKTNCDTLLDGMVIQ